MAESRNFADEFGKLAGKDTAITNSAWDGYGGLRFHYDYTAIEIGEWTAAHIPNLGFLAQVEGLLTEMGIELGVASGVKPRDWALHCIVREHREQGSEFLHLDDGRAGILLHVGEAAAGFWAWQRTRHLEEQHGYDAGTAVYPVWLRLLKGFREVHEKRPELRITRLAAAPHWGDIEGDHEGGGQGALFVSLASLAGTVAGFQGTVVRAAMAYWLDLVKDSLLESADDTVSIGSDGSITITGLGEGSARNVQRIIERAQERTASPTALSNREQSPVIPTKARSSFSARDQKLHDELIKLKGEECFYRYRDAQLIEEHLKNARVVLGDRTMTAAAVRACLRRIRQHHNYSLSRGIPPRN